MKNYEEFLILNNYHEALKFQMILLSLFFRYIFKNY